MAVHIVKLREELPRWIRERVIKGKMTPTYHNIPNNLREIQEGVCVQGNGDPSNVHSPLIIVHPFDKGNAHTRDYLGALERVVRRYPGPLITFESYISLQKTSEVYLRAGREKESYFIKTHSGDPDPTHATWDSVFQFLRLFKNKELFAAGGYLWKHPNEHGVKKGCLKNTLEKLREHGLKVEVIPRLTYDWRE